MDSKLFVLKMHELIQGSDFEDEDKDSMSAKFEQLLKLQREIGVILNSFDSHKGRV